MILSDQGNTITPPTITVAPPEVSVDFQAREYKDMVLYKAKKAWMDAQIWSEE